MRLSLAGFAATAVTFGPARTGFGLFLPYFRDDFGLSTALLGLIAGGLYLGYLLAVAAAGLLALRVGPLTFVATGLVSAALGMALVAFAPNAPVLAAGIVLAGSSAGWSWSPYNDAAARLVAEEREERTLAVISTGTSIGILAAGVAALLAGADWRLAWIAFAVAALAALAPNAAVLGGLAPRTASDAGGGGFPWIAWRRWLLRGESAPLFVVALAFGVVNAFYFSFAVDLVVATGLSRTFAGPVLYAMIGLGGLAGLVAGDAEARFGIRPVLLATLAALAAAAFSLGAWPDSWFAIGASAALFGAGVMVMSALLSIWSAFVFAARPAIGFSATLFAFGIGLTVGPVALSALVGPFGLEAAFFVAGAVALLAAFARPQGA